MCWCRVCISSTRMQHPVDLINNIIQGLRPWPGPWPSQRLLSGLGRGGSGGQASGRSPDGHGHVRPLDGNAQRLRCLHCPGMRPGLLPGQGCPGTRGHTRALCLGASKDGPAALAGEVAVGVGCRELLPAQPAALSLAPGAPAAAPSP